MTTRTGRGPGQGPGRSQVQDERRYGRHCADNTGDKNLAIMTVKGIGGRLNKITVTRLDVMCMCSVKKGKLVPRKKVMSTVVICQRMSRHRKESIFIYFEEVKSADR